MAVRGWIQRLVGRRPEQSSTATVSAEPEGSGQRSAASRLGSDLPGALHRQLQATEAHERALVAVTLPRLPPEERVADIEPFCHRLFDAQERVGSMAALAAGRWVDALTNALIELERWKEARGWLQRYFALPDQCRTWDSGVGTLRRRLMRCESHLVPEFRRPGRTGAGAPGERECWVPAGQSVEVDGREIPGGLLYFGRRLPAPADPSSPDPALIDPRRRVSWSHPDRGGSRMDYWPSYSEVQSESRAAYLEWLIEGRKASDVYIGYAFLYFYGLERRALHDLAHQPEHPELEQIEAEVERLLGIYAHRSGSFFGYASSLRDYMQAKRGIRVGLDGPPPIDVERHELTFKMRAGLAQAAQAGAPLPADWALAWYLTGNSLRTAAQRCPDEFHELFRQRYAERFGSGLVLTPNRRELVVSHHPASAGLRGLSFVARTGVADVGSLTGPVNRIASVVDQCQDELGPYGRFVGRSPNARSSLAALALLPRGLEGHAPGASGAEFEALVEEANDSEQALPVESDRLLALWPTEPGHRLRKQDHVRLCQLFAGRGIGVEPDPRFGGRVLQAGSQAVLFRLPDGASNAPSAAFEAASLLVTLSAAVATADAEVTPAEQRALERHLEAELGLEEQERARLAAHLRWLLLAPPTFRGLKKRLAALGSVQRRAIGAFAVAVAAVDGNVAPEEVALLTKCFRLLGLDPGEVHRQLHARAAAAAPSEPVLVRPGRPTKEHAIPRTPGRPASAPAFSLDARILEAKLAETAAVSALLADVLADDDPSGVPREATAAEDQAASLVNGLDAAHSALLRRLAESPSWERPDLEALCNELGLLASGALERINELALDRLDEPALEDDDPVEVYLDVTERLLA